jgi:hypothetical protein
VEDRLSCSGPGLLPINEPIEVFALRSPPPAWNPSVSISVICGQTPSGTSPHDPDGCRSVRSGSSSRVRPSDLRDATQTGRLAPETDPLALRAWRVSGRPARKAGLSVGLGRTLSMNTDETSPKPAPSTPSGPRRRYVRTVGPRLRWVLLTVLGLVALLGANSAYLGCITFLAGWRVRWS